MSQANIFVVRKYVMFLTVCESNAENDCYMSTQEQIKCVKQYWKYQTIIYQKYIYM